MPRALLAFWAVSVLGGCCSDDAERPPWERDGGGRPSAGDAAAGSDTADAATPFAFVEGQVDLEGSRVTLELGGTRVTPGGLVRAWLEADLDADGDSDAVVLQARASD